jgi:hypothetical protein
VLVNQGIIIFIYPFIKEAGRGPGKPVIPEMNAIPIVIFKIAIGKG